MDKLSELVILFGSETGTSEDYAETIWREGRRRGWSARYQSMDSFPVQCLPEQSVVVFICATSGQGDVPRNMRKFWKFLLRRNLPKDSLSECQIGVLALGDSSYSKFNYSGKRLFRRLLNLGATAMLDLALADDQHPLGADGAANPWMTELWNVLGSKLPADQIPDPLTPLPAKFTLEYLSGDGNINSSRAAVSRLPLRNEYHSVRMIRNERVTDINHFQDTRLFEFGIPEEKLEELGYEPGDVLVVKPSNLPRTVQKFIAMIGLSDDAQLDRPFRLNSPFGYELPDFPSDDSRTITLRRCIETYWDLQCIPRRAFFQILAQLSTDELEKERLTELSDPGNYDDLLSYCNRPRKNVVEVLEDFGQTTKGNRIPLEYWFDLLTPIRPRSFSIASAPSHHPDVIQILVAVVKYKTRMAFPREGLCSSWLASLSPGDRVPVFIEKGTFSFPDYQRGNCILIGPGTGIAPFRSFAWERHEHQVEPLTHVDNGGLVGSGEKGKCLLFFGCRSSTSDFYFREEWDLLKKSCDGGFDLITAFSRDQEEKVYIQHRIKDQGKQVWDLMSSNDCRVYIAGNAKQMPENVKSALIEVLQAYGSLTEDEAKAQISEMEQSGKLQMETWA